jgi:hypothetical protein
MAVVLGKNIFIFNGSSGTTALIAAAKSCTITKKIELIERASSTQATAKEYVTGRYEWEVSLDHIVTTGAPYDGLLKVGNSYTVCFAVKTGTSSYSRKYGSAICVQADISGTVGGIGKGSVRFKGNGALT